MPSTPERRVETLGDFPHHTVVVTVPDGAWRQGNGKPGYVDFEVYPIVGVQDDGTLLYELKGAGSSADLTSDIAEAGRCAEGSVKWDGCVNYQLGDIDQESPVLLHACGADSLAQYLAAVQRAYDLAAELVGVDLS